HRWPYVGLDRRSGGGRNGRARGRLWHQPSGARAHWRESRTDFRARIPEAPIRFWRRLVLLLRARLGCAAVSAGHRKTWNEARILFGGGPFRRGDVRALGEVRQRGNAWLV